MRARFKKGLGLAGWLVAVALSGALPSAASASTITVTNTNDSGLGSLRQAIAEATPGSMIVLPSSTSAYAVTSEQLKIEKSLTIDGAGAAGTVIEATGGSHAVVEVGASGVTISGVTITGGRQGVDLESGSLTLSDAKVSQNGSGGIDGGGIETRSSTTLTVNASAIEGNTGYNGGGLYLGGDVSITDSTIAGNHAAGDDGGIDSGSETLTLVGDTISANIAKENVGALYVGGDATITNTTIAGNQSAEDGGAIESGAKSLTLLNDTIAGNEAQSEAGIDGKATATNTIVAENTNTKGHTENCTEALTVGGPNLESGSECGFAGHDGGIAEVNPELGSLAANGGPTETMALLADSPAIDRGANTECPATDQRGGARPQPTGGTCDIGAFEYGALADLSISQTASPSPATAGEVLTYTVSVSNGGPGPDPSFGTAVTDTLPAGATLVSAVPSQGSCPTVVAVSAGPVPVSCMLGTLAHGASAQIAITVRPSLTGTATNLTSVSTSATDPNLANNISQLATIVLAAPPSVPTMSALGETAKTWREHGAPAHAHSKRKKPPVGTTFTFTLNEPASVTFTFTTTKGGRKVGKSCAVPTKKNKRRKRCTRTVLAGVLAFSAKAGLNTVRFTGAAAKGKKLKPGSYTLLASATASGKHSTTDTLRFTIVG